MNHDFYFKEKDVDEHILNCLITIIIKRKTRNLLEIYSMYEFVGSKKWI